MCDGKGSSIGATRVENGDDGHKSGETSSRRWGLRRYLRAEEEHNVEGDFQAETAASGVSEARGSAVRHPWGWNLVGDGGLEVRLESRGAVGHCRGHIEGLGLCAISRESIKRHQVDKCCALFVFSIHPSSQTLRSLCPCHRTLSPTSELNTGDIKWLAQGYALRTCQSRDSNPGLLDSRAPTLNHSTPSPLMPSENLSHCLQLNLILILIT